MSPALRHNNNNDADQMSPATNPPPQRQRRSLCGVRRRSGDAALSATASSVSGGGSAAKQARKSTATAPPAGQDDSDLFDIQENDDVAERRQQQLAATADSGGGERRNSLTAGISGLSRAQLSEHYSNCIRLNAENKISTKNAFSLQLIDCLAAMLQRKDSKFDNFQMASVSMDASAKIYGYRVDVLHGDTLRMAGGLGRSDEKRRAGGDDDAAAAMNGADESDADDDDGGRAGAGKKRKTRRRKTVEYNLSNITQTAGGGVAAAAADMMSSGDVTDDTLFERLQNSAAGGGGGESRGGHMFQWVLPLVSDNNQLLMMHDGDVQAEKDAGSITDHSAGNDRLPDADWLSSLSAGMTGGVICERTAVFSFGDWSVDASDDQTREQRETPSLTSASQAPQAFSELSNVAHKHRFNANGIPETIAEEDENVFEDAYEDNDEENGSATATSGALCVAANAGTQLASLVTDVRQEYSYFDCTKFQALAGPRHWRLPASKTVGEQTGGGGVARKIVRAAPSSRKQRCVKIDWSRPAAAVEAAFSSSRKTTTISATTMKKWSVTRTTLPEDLHYELKALFRTFHRASVLYESAGGSDQHNNNGPQRRADDGTSEPTAVDLDGSVASYDYDNQRDVDEYCPRVAVHTTGDEYGDGDGQQEVTFMAAAGGAPLTATQWDASQLMVVPSSGVSAPGSVAANLVDAPIRVERLHVAYARVAKKVDMRRIKHCMWDILTTTDDNKENGAERDPSSSPSVKSSSTPAAVPTLSSFLSRGASFQQLYSQLLCRLSVKMAADMSVALAFTALLHTANERGLVIEQAPPSDTAFSDVTGHGRQPLDDLVIRQ